MTLSCPKCDRAMTAEQHEGIELDRCADCGGLFFDAGELDTILARLAGHRVDGNQPEPHGKMDQQAATCPRCDVAMNADEGPRTDLHVDRCPQCEGVFLDKGELGTLQLWKTLTGG